MSSLAVSSFSNSFFGKERAAPFWKVMYLPIFYFVAQLSTFLFREKPVCTVSFFIVHCFCYLKAGANLDTFSQPEEKT